MFKYITKDNLGEFSDRDVVTPGYDFSNRVDCWRFITSYVSYYKFRENWGNRENEMLKAILLRLQLLAFDGVKHSVYNGSRLDGETDLEFLKRFSIARSVDLRMYNDFVSVVDWFEGCGCSKVYREDVFPGMLDRFSVYLLMNFVGNGDIYEDIEYSFREYLECLCFLINSVRKGEEVDEGYSERLWERVWRIDDMLQYSLKSLLPSGYRRAVLRRWDSEFYLFLSE